MQLVRRKGQVVYEDLLRELEKVEQQLMSENSAMAMSVMVLEAKLRDRFQQMDQQSSTASLTCEDLLIKDDLSAEEIEALIPRDLPVFPRSPAVGQGGTRRTFETIGLAALLAMATACGVFGLATALQMLLGWMA